MWKKLLAVFAILLIGAAGAGSYYLWITSPMYALNELRVALETRDRAKFNTYADVPVLIQNVVNALLEQAVKDAVGEPKAGPEAVASSIGAAIGASIGESMKPQFQSMAEEQINSYFAASVAGAATIEPTPAVADSTSNPAPAPSTNASSETVQLETMAASLPVEFVAFKNEIRKGETATMVLEWRHKVLKKNLDLELQFERRDKSWKLVHIPNVAQANKLMETWEKDYVAKANVPVREYLNKIFADVVVRRVFAANEYGLDARFEVISEGKNLTGRDVKSASGTFRVLHKSLFKKILEIPLEIGAVKKDELYQGSTDSEKIRNMNWFTEREFLEGADEDFAAEIEIHRVEFADGTIVGIYTSLADIRAAQQRSRQTASTQNP